MEEQLGARTETIFSYELPKWFYANTKGGAVWAARKVGCLLRYAMDLGYTRKGRKGVIAVDVEKLLERWREVIVGLAVAHDKDEADRYEAAIDQCLSPLLTAPIKQVREFANRFLEVIKNDPRVPFLVWRSYEIWVEHVIAKAPDEDIKELKTELAREIATMVEGDLKDQLPDALVRALQWRSPERLAEVKQVVEAEKAKGKSVRLRGRESCLFMEAGGTEDDPAVCIQI